MNSNTRFRDIRIIIPVFNPGECLFRTLGALQNDLPVSSSPRVIVVDDGSSNGVSDRVACEFPEVKVIRGDGNLWWAGGMKLGMKHALAEDAKVIVWLNHDCQPEAGTIHALAIEALKQGTGAVSAWCYTRGYKEFPVNPGFRKFRQIPLEDLKAGAKLPVHGVNGNCVAINADAVRSIGLPNVSRHPHYGDGPYMFRLHKSGFANWVLPTARAALDREFERCIDEGRHSALWGHSLLSKLNYYFFSKRSKFHWRNRFWDAVAFRGALIGVPVYIASQVRLIAKVSIGHLQGYLKKPETLIESIVENYNRILPAEELRKSLEKLASKSYK